MKLDLKKIVTDVNGQPIPDKATLTNFDRPVSVHIKQTGDTFENISRLIGQQKDLTFRKAIVSALRQAGNQRGDEFDKDDCATLMFQLVADTDVDLNVDQRNLIRDACKAHSDTEVYFRVKNFLFPE